MKTPREILLNRHQSAAPKLDAIRRTVMKQCREGRRVAVPKFRVAGTATLPILIWRELIFPSRRIWAGLAMVWIFIFIANFTLRDHSPKNMTGASAALPEMMSFKDPQKFVDKLFADRSLPLDSDRPKVFSPKPRTETTEYFAV